MNKIDNRKVFKNKENVAGEEFRIILFIIILEKTILHILLYHKPENTVRRCQICRGIFTFPFLRIPYIVISNCQQILDNYVLSDLVHMIVETTR